MYNSNFAVEGSFLKPLNPDEEAYHLDRSANGDKNSRDILAERNLRLVVHIVKKYSGSITDSRDLISIGTIGLIKGIATFNNKKGVKLATYAAKCIENEILMHLRQQKKENHTVSLHEPIGKDFEGNEITFLEILSNHDRDLEDGIHAKNQAMILHEKMKKVLKNRERFILILRYGLRKGGTKTQREIGKALGISRSYVSRIEKKAIHKLRGALETDLRVDRK